jgi:Chaperone of endosialidase
MAWYNPLTWGEKTASTTLTDYAKGSQFQDRGQIMGQITPGMATNRQAPQTTTDNPFRSAQLNQLGQLQGIASGQQQGAGELAVQRQAQNAQAAQQAQMRMRGGGAGGGLASLNQANAGAGISSNAMGMGQQAAMGDQMNAQGLAAQIAAQGSGQDQQTKLANLDAQLKQMGMDDAQRLAYLQQLTGMNATSLQTSVGAMQAAQAGNKPGIFPGLLQVGGQLGAAALMPGAMASDERLKEEITDAGSEVDAMLDALHAKAYKYKDEKWGKGRRAGIMAQDLERSEAGKRIVMDTPEGKLLDVNKAVSAALASSARLNERIRKLERKAG